jgi:hypothetical protein
MSVVYSKNPDVVFRKIADEFILVPVRQKVVDLKSIYTMNDTAALVWELVDGKTGVSAIRDRVAGEFEVDIPQAELDVSELIRQLESLGLIEKA